MRRVRELLRLKRECGASDRAIGRSLGIARSTVALTQGRVAAAGLAWPLSATLSDRVLESMLYAGAGTKQGFRVFDEPRLAAYGWREVPAVCSKIATVSGMRRPPRPLPGSPRSDAHDPHG